MSFGVFFLGLVMMIAGFFMVARTNFFLNNFGDLGPMVGLYDKAWASWKFFGVALLVLGFLIAFGLLQLLFLAIFGSIFTIGSV